MPRERQIDLRLSGEEPADADASLLLDARSGRGVQRVRCTDKEKLPVGGSLERDRDDAELECEIAREELSNPVVDRRADRIANLHLELAREGTDQPALSDESALNQDVPDPLVAILLLGQRDRQLLRSHEAHLDQQVAESLRTSRHGRERSPVSGPSQTGPGAARAGHSRYFARVARRPEGR
jgi:hypothetical protein